MENDFRHHASSNTTVNEIHNSPQLVLYGMTCPKTEFLQYEQVMTIIEFF